MSSSTKNILIVNGPNLGHLGVREVSLYGSRTLVEWERMWQDKAQSIGINLTCRQSDCEAEIIGWCAEAYKDFDGLILNAAAYSHTSLAIQDALCVCPIPTVEVHFSNIYRREEERRTSYVSRVADAVICGVGGEGYLLALEAIKMLTEK